MQYRPIFLDKTSILLFCAFGVTGAVMLFFNAGFEGLDLRLSYSGEEAFRSLDILTVDQRSRYHVVEFLDFLYIAIYTAFLFLNFRKVRAKAVVLMMTFVPAIFDVLENVGIIYWLNAPDRYFYLQYLGWITHFKWLSGLGLVLDLSRRYFALSKNSDRNISHS